MKKIIKLLTLISLIGMSGLAFQLNKNNTKSNDSPQIPLLTKMTTLGTELNFVDSRGGMAGWAILLDPVNGLNKDNNFSNIQGNFYINTDYEYGLPNGEIIDVYTIFSGTINFSYVKDNIHWINNKVGIVNPTNITLDKDNTFPNFDTEIDIIQTTTPGKYNAVMLFTIGLNMINPWVGGPFYDVFPVKPSIIQMWYNY